MLGILIVLLAHLYLTIQNTRNQQQKNEYFTATAKPSIPAQRPTATTAASSIPAQQPTATTAAASVPAQQPTTTTTASSIPAQTPTTTTAIVYTPTNAADLRFRLWALLTIFQKVLTKLLESQGQIELQYKNASELEHTIMFHALSNKTNKKEKEKQYGYNEHLFKENKVLRKSIDHKYFDVTLLVKLIKNVNKTNCFNDFRKTCNNKTCNDCSVKYAVEDVRKLRNTSAHETNYRLDEFLNKTEEFHDFEGRDLGTYEKFMQHFKKQFHILHRYLKDGSKFPQSNVFGGPIVDNILAEDLESVCDLPQKDMINRNFLKKILTTMENASEEAIKNFEELKVRLHDLIKMSNDDSKKIDRLHSYLQPGEVDPTPIGREHSLNPLNLDKWLDKCRDLYDEVYKTGVNFFDFVHPGPFIERFLNEWFIQKVRDCNPLKYALIGRYNAMENKSYEEGSLEKNSSFDKHCLIFNLVDGCIYYIRQTEATLNENIKEEHFNLKQEVKCFRDRYKKALSSGANIDIYRILIQTNETEGTIKVLNEVDNLSMLAEEETETLDSFHARLRKFEEGYLEEKDFGDSFPKILSRVLGFSSLLFKEIPHINDDVYTKISKIPLTREQKTIVDSNDARHVILCGSYGTGKTLVLQRKIYKLAAESSQAISIYVILADSTSMLYGHTNDLLADYKDKLTKKGKQVKIESCLEVLHPEENMDSGSYDVKLCLMTFTDYFSLKSLDPSNDVNTILEGIIKDKKNVHIFIDEFDAKNLTEEAAKKLDHLLKNELKDSNIYIVPQPLRRFTDQNFEAKPKGYRFGDTGMEIELLKKAIRNPKSVYELCRVVKEVIMEFKPEYQLKNFEKTEGEESDEAHLITEDIYEEIDVITEENEKADEEGIELKFNAASNVQNDLPLESFFQGTFHLSNDSNYKKIMNNYRLEDTSKCEHALTGIKPTCFIPFKIDIKSHDEISNQPVLHLTMALKAANAHKKGSVVICSSIHQSELCYQALEETCKETCEIKIHLPSLNRCRGNDAVDCYQKLKNNVIITDFMGARGMDLKNVIVVFSTIDYYFAPYFLEALTRASGRLSIVLLNLGYKTPKYQNTPIAVELVDRCYEEKLIKKVVYSCKKSKLIYGDCTDFDDIIECNGSSKDHEKYFGTKGDNSRRFDQSDIEAFMGLVRQDENISIQGNDQTDFDEIDEKAEDKKEEIYGKTEDKEKKFYLSNAQIPFKQSELWIRLAVCVNVHIKKAMLRVLHNEINDTSITPVPSDPVQLFSFMVRNKKTLDMHLKKKNLYQDDYDELLPLTKKVDSSRFSISVIRYLIRTFNSITNIDGNWKQPRMADRSIAAAITRAGRIRNTIFHHKGMDTLNEKEFEEFWNEIENVLLDLQYNEDITAMKNQSLDPTTVKMTT